MSAMHNACSTIRNLKPEIKTSMSREPILSADDAEPQPEAPPTQTLTSEEDLALRPKRLEDMVGQRKVYERLMIAVQAAQIRKEPLGHILLDGPPGLGKTTFATCIPRLQ